VAPQATRPKSKDDALTLSSRLRSSIACHNCYVSLWEGIWIYSYCVTCRYARRVDSSLTHTWKFHTFSSYMLCSLTRGQPVIHVDMLALLVRHLMEWYTGANVQTFTEMPRWIVSATQYVEGRSNPDDIGLVAFHGTPNGACQPLLSSGHRVVSHV